MIPLSERQKLALLHSVTTLSAEEISSLQDSDFTHDFFVRHGISAPAIMAADLSPLKLKNMGTESAQALKTDLKFSSLDLACSPAFCRSAVAAYGCEAVIDAFVATRHDAVAIANTEACDILRLTIGDLLVLCEHAPTQAYEVLKQTKSLKNVAILTLDATSITDDQLKKLGLSRPVL
jgi:hypothetical protein